ncbi:hypothetical protein PMAC_001351 [Pneumocystis sp. 'macacae']|nr:hypothetical protein PMAC_001351 [Pneumocystis sp. 'macacae']
MRNEQKLVEDDEVKNKTGAPKNKKQRRGGVGGSEDKMKNKTGSNCLNGCLNVKKGAEEAAGEGEARIQGRARNMRRYIEPHVGNKMQEAADAERTKVRQEVE